MFATNARIERFSLTNNQWLSPIILPAIYGNATAFHVDSDGLYVAYGVTVKRYSTNGSNELHLINVADKVHGILSDGNLLLLNHSVSLYTRMTSINKVSNTVIAQYETYIDSVSGACIAPSLHKIIGRSVGVNPEDITYVTYTADGNFTGVGDSPHHGAYPGASRTWMFPSETEVVDDSGTVYSTSDLHYLNSFAGTITDLAFFGMDIPIVLRGSNLVAYSNTLLPTGSYALPVSPKNIFVAGSNVLAFSFDGASSNSIRVDSVPLSNLNPPTPGQPLVPFGLIYTPDDTFIGRDGIVYLFSKSFQSLFRWDTLNQQYLVSIPLIGSPSFAAYSPTNNTVYLAYSSGLIRKLDLSDTNLSEVPFANLPSAPLGLSTAGSYVFAADASGAWNSHYTFDAAGSMVASVDWNFFSQEYIWCAANQKMYFFRDDTSPNDLLWEQINANATAYPTLPAGAIGTHLDSPLHDSAGFDHPIRVAPDGSIVVLGSGVIHDGTTLARLPTALGNSITDAAWIGGRLRSIRTTAGLTQLQQWNDPNYGLGNTRQLPGTALRLLEWEGHGLVGVSLHGGRPAFYVMDSDFNIIAPPTLAAPSGLLATIVSSSQLNLAWNDVDGEESYIVERKTGLAGSWVQLGVLSTSATNFTDTTVALGAQYFYRVTAVNKTQTSVPSTELAVALIAPGAPTNVSAVALSPYVIAVLWSDTTFETGYVLERQTDAGAWTQVAALLGNVTGYTNTGLTPSTTYSYRLKATNGIGTSAVSPVASATTGLVLPTAPVFVTAIASGPTTVSLTWQDAYYEDGYVIERRSGTNGSWAFLATAARNAVGYIDRSVSPVSSYDYRLYATNALGDSAYSSTRTVTTPALPPPSTPTLLAAPLNRSSVLVSWTDVPLASGYRLERRTEDTNAWAAIAILAAGTVSFSDTGLIKGMQYWYRIQAFNTNGSSAYSTADDAVPADIVPLLSDSYDPDYNRAAWSSVLGGVATNGGVGFLGSKALYFSGAGTRAATTVRLNVAAGGDVSFRFRAGNEASDGTVLWNNSESGESVVLEYSRDNGSSWVLITTLNTVFPSYSNWVSLSFSIPTAAFGTNTQFRWRQLQNSGPGYDSWALDDVAIVGSAPEPPAAVPFIISSPSSSTSIAIYWMPADGAFQYIIERKSSAQAWTSLGTVPARDTFFTDVGLMPDTAYTYRVTPQNAGGTGPVSSLTTSFTWSSLDQWVADNYGSPDFISGQELILPAPDGSLPLLRYAYNLSADEPPHILQPDGTNGYPRIGLDPALQRLVVEFVRRKSAMKPGIEIAVQFGNVLGTWTNAGSAASVQSINTTWERVRYVDTISATDGGTRFGRVVVIPK